MINFIDEVLSWPKNIDIYFYSPGSGGEFFTSLCAIAHLPTREILTSKNLEAVKRPENENQIIFKSQSYFDFEFIHINQIGKQIFFWSKYMDPITKINYYKNVLAHVILNNNMVKDETNLYNISCRKKNLENVNIILCTHWLHNIPSTNEKNFKNRTFGIPLCEREKYWNFINLDPQTTEGKNFVVNFCERVELVKNPDKIRKIFEHTAFKNIKLKFPFMDYMVREDFNSIKNYIVNRYGPDNIDYNFIDQALINYKKIRIDPYL